MSSYSLTKSRAFQYVGILLALAALPVGYWYFSVRASTLNKSPTSSLTSGLVGYWTFDGADISGTTATDRSGNANNGTLSNGPTKTEGKLGQALNFDGADLSGITADAPDNMAQFTVCSWIKPNSLTNGDLDSRIAIASKYWQFDFDTSGILRLYMHTDSTYGTTYSTSAITTGIWQHVCAVYNGHTILGGMFINGMDNTDTWNSTGGSGVRDDDSGSTLSIAMLDNPYGGNLNGALMKSAFTTARCRPAK